MLQERDIIENTPTLETERLTLRKFTTADTEALFALLCDEEVNTFLPWFPVKTLEQAEKHLADRFLSSYQKASAYRYAICLKTDDKPIGYVGVSDGVSYDFGYMLGKAYWSKGIGTEAAKAVVERLRSAGFPYITATHDVNNPASGEVMKKLGMTYRYSYVEQWQPKDITVTFKLYQLNFDGNDNRVCREYWDKYPTHWIDEA